MAPGRVLDLRLRVPLASLGQVRDLDSDCNDDGGDIDGNGVGDVDGGSDGDGGDVDVDGGDLKISGWARERLYPMMMFDRGTNTLHYMVIS